MHVFSRFATTSHPSLTLTQPLQREEAMAKTGLNAMYREHQEGLLRQQAEDRREQGADRREQYSDRRDSSSDRLRRKTTSGEPLGGINLVAGEALTAETIIAYHRLKVITSESRIIDCVFRRSSILS